uniref:G-patch domain-containing protein n=1 Tax=Panagrolaimus sp. PS1159 TaxID=55785 RepID=A0AC35FRB0_9BILA
MEKTAITNLCSKYSNSLTFKDGNKKSWKKDDSSTTTNNSTLYLHIAAYENSTEVSTYELLNESLQKSQLIQTFVSQNSFEFSRQQSDRASDHEISQFRASQRLLSSNAASSDGRGNAFHRSSSNRKKDIGGSAASKMPTHADELLQSLLGEVQAAFGSDEVDVSALVSKSAKTSRIQLSPPKLFIEDAKEKEKREKREKQDKERHQSSSKLSPSTAPTNKPWLIEPMKKMPVVDDLPIGADFQLFHPKIKADQPKDSPSKKEKKKKKDKERSSKKKKSKEDEQKERLELVPRSLSMKNLPLSEPKSRKSIEDGEICDDGQNNGWMSLSAEKAKNLETTDDILKRKLEKAHKKKKKKDKEKEEDKNKDKEEKSSSGGKKHKSKKEKKDSSKDKAKETDDKNKKEKDKHRESKDRHQKDERNRDKHDKRERDRLKSTGSLVKPLSPKKDSSERSKILPTSWSKQLNNLLKDSNQEFSSSSKDHSESLRDKDKRRPDNDDSSSHHSKHFDERDRSHRNEQGSSHHRSRDNEKSEHYSIPKRRDRSRSRTPAVGRGRNFFRRTDAEWREHQIERIRKRNQSPVRIHKEDYMDKYGNIDKKKLMDVATRNVTKLAMCGALPKGYELLSTIKNKTVQQLVDLCQQLHDEDERARFDRPSSESEEDNDDRYCGGWENDNTFSHRDVKDPEKPRYEVIDGTPFLVKSEEEQRHEDSFLRVSYPVSSGMEHRQKELEPADDEIQPLALSTALARIKTNIPPAFMNSMQTEMFPLIEPLKPLPLPPPEPPSRAFTDFTASLSSSTGQNQDIISNMLGTTETLNRPIEISMPTDTQNKAISPVVPAKKPLMIRASFLKSGKKAAEEALKKILPGPEPVPPPDLSLLAKITSSNVESVSSNNASKTSEPIPLPYILPLDPIVPIVQEPSSETAKEVTHSDALSAILDRVDQLMTTGKINEMATVEKKDLNLLKTPEKLSENYVKIPGGGIIKEEPSDPSESRMKVVIEESDKKVEMDKAEDTHMEIVEETNAEQESLPSEVLNVTENESEEKKKKEKKDKKEKKEKKRKHHREEMEDGEIREKKPKHSLKVETSRKQFGPEIPDIVKKERPLPSAIANDFDYRSPLPFIKALTAPQLSIEALPAKGSLKAEWNDPRNPLVASIKDDDSLPLPFRIIPPTVQPLVKPEDLVFKTPRCITHPPRMINDLVSRRAKYSLILQQDPNDRYARRQIEDIDRDMSAWAESKNIPGRFTGRTGARVLSVDELAPSDPRYNSWARKDLFLTAPEHESEFGKKILESMGWQKGNGLGRQMNGTKEPLKLDIKADRRGLSTGNEKGSGKRETIQDVNGKNPVSLVMEYTSRHRLQPPTFTCIESGPSTARRFLWKVTIDGVEYQPSMPSTNKKAGKAQVCVVVLQSLGLIPPVL